MSRNEMQFVRFVADYWTLLRPEWAISPKPACGRRQSFDSWPILRVHNTVVLHNADDTDNMDERGQR